MTSPPELAAPPLVQTASWLYRPINFMNAARKRHGDTFAVRFLGFQTPMVMISSPEAIRALYAARENGLPPGRTVALEPVMGSRSVLLLEGEDHLARRRLMLPPFHGERMRAYEGLIERTTRAEMASWPHGEPFAIHPRMQAITLEVILRAVFGVSDPARLERLRTALAGLLDTTASPRLAMRVLLARRFGRADPLADLAETNAAINATLATEIAERRNDPQLEQREDILSLLVAARFEDGEPMADGEIRDQLITLLLAGHETTATGLAWTLDLLLRNRRAHERLVREIDAGEEDYLRAVISEALRLRPVVPLAGRRLGAELQVEDYLLPAGTDVTPAIWLAHTRPETYPAPLEFRPERFLEGKPDTYSWIPFGGGTRRCLGAAFAELEMRVVLREVLGSLELRGARSAPERIARRNITFSPREGTPVIVAPRSSSAARPDSSRPPPSSASSPSPTGS